MKAISLWQPWASWVAFGWKPIETRTHGRFACLVGETIVIHAAQKWDEDAVRMAWQYLNHSQITATPGLMQLRGCLICTAFVSYGIHPLTSLDSAQALLDCRGKGLYGFVLTDIKPMKPIPWKGHQGVFEVFDWIVKAAQ